MSILKGFENGKFLTVKRVLSLDECNEDLKSGWDLYKIVPDQRFSADGLIYILVKYS